VGRPSWTKLIVGAVLISAGAGAPFTKIAGEARKAAHETQVIDSYLARLGDNDVIVEGEIVPKFEVEVRLARLRAESRLPGFNGEIAATLLEDLSLNMETADGLRGRRERIADEVRVWTLIQLAASVAVVAGFAMAVWAFVRRTPRKTQET
jgi:hypothetical protein